MEQVLVMNLGGLRTLDSQIGVFMDNTFFISEGCLDALEEIQKGLLTEDKNTRYFRRYCALYDIVRKNLLPLLFSLDDDVNSDIENKDSIFFAAVKVLAHISQPLECLIPNLRVQLQTLEKFRKSEATQQIPHKLIELETLVKETQLLPLRIKQAFTKAGPTKIILGRLTDMIKEDREKKLSEELCDAMDNMFFLYRNLLYLSDSPTGAACSSKEISLSTIILRLLFQFGLKDVVLYCVNSPQYEKWTLSIIELITLMYKDPERTLCHSYQPSLGASSENSDETATDDSQYFTEAPATGSDVSAATRIEGCAMVEAFQPLATLVTSDTRRSLAGSASSKTAESLTSEVTIIFVREKLREFSYTLLSNGYARLLCAVKTLLVNDVAQPQTSMYYMWNLSFCLMMAHRFNVSFAAARDLLSVYTVDYLIYTCAVNSEKLLLCQQRGEDCTAYTNKIDLALTGLKYMFKCLDFYWRSTELSAEERQYLFNIQVMLVQQSDLRHVLLLLIRLYKPATHQLSYLKCVIKLNHAFLTMTELLLSVDSRRSYFDMKVHISNFATNEVMRQYGTLLTHYRVCSAQTVEQVFTMMHHVATDCGRPQTLLQLPILNAFCMLEEGPYKQLLSQECKDLMEYSFQQYMQSAECDPMHCAKLLLNFQEETQDGAWSSSGSPDDTTMEVTAGAWSKAELDELYQICMACDGCDDFEETVRRELDAVGINKDLNQVDWESLGVNAGGKGAEEEEEYSLPRDLGQNEDASKSLLQLGLDQMDITELSSCSDKVTFYVDKLRHTGHTCHVDWIQRLLLETCYIRLGGFSLARTYPEEPVQLIHILMRKAIPIVTYTEEQELFVKNKYFKGLMTELGIEGAAQDEEVYPRIPHSWDVQHLIQKAEQLGPVDYSKTKFTPQDVKAYCDKMTSLPFNSPESAAENSVTECESSMWMLYIGKANARA